MNNNIASGPTLGIKKQQVQNHGIKKTKQCKNQELWNQTIPDIDFLSTMTTIWFNINPECEGTSSQ